MTQGSFSLQAGKSRSRARRESLERMREAWGKTPEYQVTNIDGERLDVGQATLTGGTSCSKVPEASLSPAEKAILRCMRSARRGLTHDQIRDRMKLSGISTFDNRLRDLRAKGYAESSFDEALKQLLWYPTAKTEGQA